jgi:hypothetical protein
VRDGSILSLKNKYRMQMDAFPSQKIGAFGSSHLSISSIDFFECSSSITCKIEEWIENPFCEEEKYVKKKFTSSENIDFWHSYIFCKIGARMIEIVPIKVKKILS